jgi:hypothetical protein
LVTSNPSPAYVTDVTNAFVNGKFTDPATGVNFGSGNRGDLQAVIAAILLNPAARGDTVPDPNGHLREPVLWLSNLLRAFGTDSPTSDFVLGERFLTPNNAGVAMDEDVLYSPTVFNFFPPGYVIPGETIFGPEFAIQSTATSLGRVNLAYEVVFHAMPTNANRPMGTWLDEDLLGALGTEDPAQIVSDLNTLMLHGTMSTDMTNTLVTAVTNITDPDPLVQALARAREAVYLVATSSQYNVER